MSDIDKILSDKMGAENGFEAYEALKESLRTQIETAKAGGLSYFEASTVYVRLIMSMLTLVSDVYEMLGQLVCADVYGRLAEFEDDCSV